MSNDFPPAEFVMATHKTDGRSRWIGWVILHQAATDQPPTRIARVYSQVEARLLVKLLNQAGGNGLYFCEHWNTSSVLDHDCWFHNKEMSHECQ